MACDFRAALLGLMAAATVATALPASAELFLDPAVSDEAETSGAQGERSAHQYRGLAREPVVQCADPAVDNRIALVIGSHSSIIRGVEEDVRAMSALLKEYGWQVILSLDATIGEFHKTLNEVTFKPERCDVLVYFSGLGGLVNGVQRLSMTRGNGEPPRDGASNADLMDVQELLFRVAGDRTVVLVDAERSHLNQTSERADAMISPAADPTPRRGLQRVDGPLPLNTLLAYGTTEGCHASASDEGGVFTQLLAAELTRDPAADIRVILDRVRILQSVSARAVGQSSDECERVDVESTLTDPWSLTAPRSPTPWQLRPLNPSTR